jgi:uncharacterized protein (DUF924 family)
VPTPLKSFPLGKDFDLEKNQNQFSDFQWKGNFAFTENDEKKSTTFRSKNKIFFMTQRAGSIFSFKIYFLDNNISMTQPYEVLKFWFGEDLESEPFRDSKLWFEKNPAFDQEIKMRFEEDLKAAANGAREEWKNNPLGRLAFIILLDQFSRNIYRGTPRMFSQDSLSLQAALEGIDKGEDQALHPIQCTFFYLPLEHSEDLEIQKKSLEMFPRLVRQANEKWKRSLKINYEYAIKHHDIIARFGRFPHRNALLGRMSTPEEIEFLKEPGSSF